VAPYLYCIRADGAEPPGIFGIDGSRVRSVEASDLFAWVSDVGDGAVDVTVDRLKAHDSVCAAALAMGDTPLPIRFGQSFADDAALVRGIADREATLRERLERVAGCVELRVVITRGRAADVNDETPAFHLPHGDESTDIDGSGVRDDASGDEGPGTSFLRRLARVGRADLAREVACEEARHAVRTAASAFIVEQQRCEATRGMAFFPVLVRRADVDVFRDMTETILSSQQIDLSVLGPFAPYSFSGDA
jgi:hypothetical protein